MSLRKASLLFFLVSGLVGLVAASLTFDWLDSPGSAQTPPVEDQRPSNLIIYETVGGGGYQQCYADGRVDLVDGVVTRIIEVSPAAKTRLRTGARVEGLPPGFDRGPSQFLQPVHFDRAGALKGGYAECVEVAG